MVTQSLPILQIYLWLTVALPKAHEEPPKRPSKVAETMTVFTHPFIV